MRSASAIVVVALLCGCLPQPPCHSYLPFEDIQASEIEFVFDASATSAVLRVETTIDVPCVVHYGKSDPYEMAAVDTAMLDPAHRDHAPVLTGLTPETDYVYQLFALGPGSDNCTLDYLSDVMQFTTPAALPPLRPGTNVAPSATVVDVSSEFSASFAAVNAIDADSGTEWSSLGDGDAAFIELDLGAPTDVIGVGFHTRTMTDGTAITNSFTVTVDGAATYGPFDAGEGLRIGAAVFTGQRIRFDVETSTGGNTGAREVEVYVTSP